MYLFFGAGAMTEGMNQNNVSTLETEMKMKEDMKSQNGLCAGCGNRISI